MKNSNADISRGRKTGVSKESTLPPRRTKTERKRGAERRAEITGVKEVISNVALNVLERIFLNEE